MIDEPVAPMQSFGHHPETLASHYHAGWCGEHACPEPDGRIKEVPIRLHDTLTGRQVVIGVLLFGPSNKLEDADMGGVDAAINQRWLPDDPRIRRFLEKYPQKLPHLGAMQLQREYPMQLPFAGRMVLIPGDVEVIG